MAPSTAPDVGRQPVPELLVDDHGVSQVAVVGEGEMLCTSCIFWV